MQGELDEVCSLSSMGAMAITDTKHVHGLALLDVGGQDEGVLVDLVRVTWFKAHSGCKSKLLDHILRLDGIQVWRVWRSWSLLRGKSSDELIQLLVIWILRRRQRN